MTFLSRLLGRQSSARARPAPEIVLPGNGSFPLAIVRESRYQDELDHICGGRTRNGVNQVVAARVIVEDGNPYDRKAVRVEINGMTVGYLDRPDARAYRKYIKRLGKSRAVGLCQANVRGGWERGAKDQGHFGVWLDFLLYG